MIKIDSSGTRVTLSIQGDFTTTELENLIGELAVQRSAMTPAVPLHYKDVSEAANFSVHEDPYLKLALLRDGRIRFWIRNSGLGWLAFNVPVDKACGVRDYLTSKLPATGKMPNVISEQDGERDKPH